MSSQHFLDVLVGVNSMIIVAQAALSSRDPPVAEIEQLLDLAIIKQGDVIASLRETP